MSEEIKPVQPLNDTVTFKKKTLMGVGAALVILFALALWQPWASKAQYTNGPEIEEAEYDTETTAPQVKHDINNKADVTTMLQNGLTVAQVAKETGMPADEVRKIKKEMKQREREKKKKEREKKN